MRKLHPGMLGLIQCSSAPGDHPHRDLSLTQILLELHQSCVVQPSADGAAPTGGLMEDTTGWGVFPTVPGGEFVRESNSTSQNGKHTGQDDLIQSVRLWFSRSKKQLCEFLQNLHGLLGSDWCSRGAKMMLHLVVLTLLARAVPKVSLTWQSGSGTLKEGDSVSLTCTVDCPLSSPQLVWFKDGGRLPESDSTLQLHALTVGNSGNYSCALKNYKDFKSESVSLSVQDTGAWGVRYSEPVCAVRGSTVSIPCTYSYPPSAGAVRRVLWCSMNRSSVCDEQQDVCTSKPPGSPGEFEYAGDEKSNCTLLIRDVQLPHSGEYKFRFITKTNHYTGDPGATLTVTVPKVSLTWRSGSGTLKEGDSVSLTCTVDCPLSSPQLVWFKDGDRLPESGSTLQLHALTVENSGNYSCALKNYEAFTSESVSLSVPGSSLNTALILAGLALVLLAVVVLAVYRKRQREKAQEDGGRGKPQVGETAQDKQTQLQTSHVTKIAKDLQGGEEMYAPVCKTPKPEKRGTKETPEEDNGGSGGHGQAGVTEHAEALLHDGEVAYACVQPIQPDKG
ncbi:hypothetical protein NFI96_021898 [Prochilodus magdalenae]|nr:hypothetical protein NFI96_021898 [Prochilodus magdalenae]